MYCTRLDAGLAVRFPLTKVICPEGDQLIANLTHRLEVTGRVIYLSDASERKGFYAVVEAKGIGSPVIVPVDQLQLVDGGVTEAPKLSG